MRKGHIELQLISSAEERFFLYFVNDWVVDFNVWANPLLLLLCVDTFRELLRSCLFHFWMTQFFFCWRRNCWVGCLPNEISFLFDIKNSAKLITLEKWNAWLPKLYEWKEMLQKINQFCQMEKELRRLSLKRLMIKQKKESTMSFFQGYE